MKRGFFQRALNFKSCPYGGSIHYTSDFQLGNFLAVFIGTSTIIWMIYLTIYWIAIGFTNE